MPISRPSLADLITRIEGDVEAGIDATAPLLRNSVLRVLSRVFAASVHLLYGYIVWIALQVMPDTAEAEWMERWAAIYGIYRVPATYASGELTVTGTNTTVVPAGTIFIAAGDVEYVSTADETVALGTATVPVNCSDSGSLGTLSTGQVLTLLSPIVGLDGSAVVAASGNVAGFDAESDDALRARVLSRIQDPPQGGALKDYQTWTFETPTVRATRVWAYGDYAGPGTVGVTFAVDNIDPIPTGPEVTAVAAYIETKRPVTAQVTVFAPTAFPIDFTIAVVPNTTAVKNAVEDALNQWILDNAGPGQTLLISKLNEVISGADGETDHTMTVPAGNITLALDELGALGTITWV